MRLSDPIFSDADKAREFFEAQRWPSGPTCPHCGNADKDKITGLKGKAHRAGLYQCNECREQFSVTVGTVFERSKIPLNKWLLASFMLSGGKKGTSAHQIHRALGVTYKTAWFMCHRIREAMRQEGLEPLGGKGKTVEADETYFGPTDKPHVSPQRRGRPYHPRSRGPRDKRAILSLVERSGAVRSFHLPTADKRTVSRIVGENIATESRLHTDESNFYKGIGTVFEAHKTVKHSAGEYVRGRCTPTRLKVISQFSNAE